jgi:hypothetical protein
MYILSSNLLHPRSLDYDRKWREQWRTYKHYLHSIQHKMRPHTRAFALADWHYNHEDPRCPHDAWFESLTLSTAHNDARHEDTSLGLVARLLGAFHDGHIELHYHNVFSYSFDFPSAQRYESTTQRKHSDWLIDEIRFSDRGKIIHEIVWASDARWIIECDNVEHRWLPFLAATDAPEA